MLVLWFIGPALETYLGHWRYLLLYVVSGLAGSAGALIWSPNALTVGASGAIWGLMGAALILEWRKIYVFGGQALGLVVLNLAFTFVVPGVSIGGHIGGLIGGAGAILAFLALRRTPALATAAVVGVGVLSIAVAMAAAKRQDQPPIATAVTPASASAAWAAASRATGTRYGEQDT
jgi:membrane associated rhomboid family serine protease